MTELQANRGLEKVRRLGFTAAVHYDARTHKYYIFVHESSRQGPEFLRTVSEVLNFLSDYGAAS